MTIKVLVKLDNQSKMWKAHLRYCYFGERAYKGDESELFLVRHLQHFILSRVVFTFFLTFTDQLN